MLIVSNKAVGANGEGSFGCLVARVGGEGVGFVSASHTLAVFARDTSLRANAGISGTVPSQVAQNATAIRAFEGDLAGCDAPIEPVTGTPLNALDAAYATLQRTTFDALARAIPLPSGARAADTYGEEVFFWGARSGCVKRARVHALYADAVVSYDLWDASLRTYGSFSTKLSELIQCEPISSKERSLPGDSGSLLFDRAGNGLGILIGKGIGSNGTPDPSYTYFARLESILRLFGLAVVTAANVPGSTLLRNAI